MRNSVKGRTAVGAFVHSTWGNLNIRCGKYRHLQTVAKCASYDSVEVRMTLSEYKEWCWEQRSLIEGLARPSLDRIDSKGHYELGNLQIVELVTNIAKEKLLTVGGASRCSRCKRVLPLEQFCRDRRRITTGRSTTCKRCDVARKYENGVVPQRRRAKTRAAGYSKTGRFGEFSAWGRRKRRIAIENAVRDAPAWSDGDGI